MVRLHMYYITTPTYIMLSSWRTEMQLIQRERKIEIVLENNNNIIIIRNNWIAGYNDTYALRRRWNESTFSRSSGMSPSSSQLRFKLENVRNIRHPRRQQNMTIFIRVTNKSPLTDDTRVHHVNKTRAIQSDYFIVVWKNAIYLFTFRQTSILFYLSNLERFTGMVMFSET